MCDAKVRIENADQEQQAERPLAVVAAVNQLMRGDEAKDPGRQPARQSQASSFGESGVRSRDNDCARAIYRELQDHIGRRQTSQKPTASGSAGDGPSECFIQPDETEWDHRDGGERPRAAKPNSERNEGKEKEWR